MPRSMLPMLIALSCAACSGQTLPAGPTPELRSPVDRPAPARATIAVMAVQENGICIEDAVLDIVSGQRAGEHYAPQGFCDAWWIGGFELRDLEPGVDLTLRFSAPGYASTEWTVAPVASYSYKATIIQLSKVPSN